MVVARRQRLHRAADCRMPASRTAVTLAGEGVSELSGLVVIVLQSVWRHGALALPLAL